jgi:hypothetical protein
MRPENHSSDGQKKRAGEPEALEEALRSWGILLGWLPACQGWKAAFFLG